MTPLARSLLALAALLVAANAQSNCNTALFGTTTGNAINFQQTSYQSGGGRITVENACQTREGRMLAGQFVSACNYVNSGVKPEIREVVPPTYSPIDIVCPDGCPGGGVVQIVQYCY